MSAEKDFQKIYDRLKKILVRYEKDLHTLINNKTSYSLEGNYSERFKKNLWFGGVEIKKNYVSYHLMPVYMYKDIESKIPEILKKKMQGKSCFNFKSYDEDLFNEMETFTEKCFKEFVKRGDKIKI